MPTTRTIRTAPPVSPAPSSAHGGGLVPQSELIARAKAGDGEAWAALLAPHLGRLRSYIAARLPEQADDLLSTVLLECVRAMPHYEDRGWPISAWLYRIAYSRVVDAQRELARRKVSPLDWHDDLPAEEDLASAVARQVDGAQIWALVDTLTPLQRQVVRALYLADLSLTDAARQLNLSTGSVKGLRHRALLALRELAVEKELV